MLPSIHVSFSAQSACAALVDGRRDGAGLGGQRLISEAENLAHLDRDHACIVQGIGGLNIGIVI